MKIGYTNPNSQAKYIKVFTNSHSIKIQLREIVRFWREREAWRKKKIERDEKEREIKTRERNRKTEKERKIDR